MTTDDILRAAVECQLITTGNRDGVYAAALVRFATLIRAAALAEQPVEQEPVAWSVFDKRTKKHWYTHDSKYTAQHYSNEYSHREPDGTPHNVVVPLYASPQPAKQPLTDAEIDSLWAAIPNQALYKAVRAFARAVEATIWEKSNG